MDSKAQRLKSVQVHLVLLGLSIAAIIAALCIIWFDVASQPSLPASFSYSADAVASQTTYSSTAPDPIAKRYLTSNIQVDLVGDEVKSKVVNATVTGDIISTIITNHSANPASGLYNNQPSATYVMPPKGLKKGQDFQMRFPTYDAVGAMEFQSEEIIQNLKTYTYKVRFDSPVQGSWGDEKVTYTPNLQIWIEPTTGWLIKYQDDAVVKPINDSSTYSRIAQKTADESVRQHIAYAKTQKTRFVFAQQVAPGIVLSIILTLGLVIAISQMKRRVVPLFASLSIIAAISLFTFVGWIIESPLITTLFVSPSAINPLAAICFILVTIGIATLYRNHRPAVAFTGGFVMILAMLQILGNLGALPFSVDLLFFKDAVITLDPTIPSRMSTFDAFAFLVISIALIKAGFTTKHTEIHFAKFIAGVAFSLGVFGLILQITQIDKAFSLTFIQSVPLVTPILFILSSYSLMQLFRSIHDKPDDIKNTLATLRWPSIATVPLVIIGMFAQIQQNNIQQSVNTGFQEKITAFESHFESRMDIAINTLMGTRGLFAASNTVTANEFQRFISNYRSDKNLENIHAIGFARMQTVQDTVTNPYTNQTTSVFPQTNNAVKTPVVYSETLGRNNAPAVGFDLASDKQLSQTLDQARDTGKAILSSSRPLLLSDNSKTTNFLVVPVYQSGSDGSTIQSRQASLQGFVFATVSISGLADTLAADLPTIDYVIYDGFEAQSDTLLFSSLPVTSPRLTTPRVASNNTRFVANHPLTIAYSADPSFRLSPQEEFAPTLVLLGGSLTYFAILTILYFLADLERRSHLVKRIKKRSSS